jgi:hypothetical protein
MQSKQLSVFLPNRKGTLSQVTEIMAGRGAEIVAFMAFDTAEFGIFRVIVRNAKVVEEALKSTGMVAKLTEVLLFVPGGRDALSGLFEELGDNDINVEYIYTGFISDRKLPCMVMKADKPELAGKLVEKRGMELLNLD